MTNRTSSTVNFSELSTRVAIDCDLSDEAAQLATRACFDAIAEAVVRGERVMLPGFGAFEALDSPARTGRNPKTGETFEIPARRRIVFRPACAFKRSINPDDDAPRWKANNTTGD